MPKFALEIGQHRAQRIVRASCDVLMANRGGNCRVAPARMAAADGARAPECCDATERFSSNAQLFDDALEDLPFEELDLDRQRRWTPSSGSLGPLCVCLYRAK
jgi:hypothetical protein